MACKYDQDRKSGGDIMLQLQPVKLELPGPKIPIDQCYVWGSCNNWVSLSSSSYVCSETLDQNKMIKCQMGMGNNIENKIYEKKYDKINEIINILKNLTIRKNIVPISDSADEN